MQPAHPLKRSTTLLFAILLALAGAAVAGCSSKPSAESVKAKHYHLVGKIISINKNQHTLMVDGEEIKGFMAAMVMSYSVRSTSQLDGLEPGDEITAELVVPDDYSGAYLEQIVVTKKTTAKPTAELHIPQPGDRVPDFVVVDQDNRRVHLKAFRGHVLLVTFIYTRCPFKNYCPLVSHDFAEIYAQTKGDPQLARSVRLLTVSFDPEHDTPAVLRTYAESFRRVTGKVPFDRWTFAAAPPKELPHMANFFGLTYSDKHGKIVHSMSTTVIAPDGRVYKWYDNNAWRPSELVADAKQVLEGEKASRASLRHTAGRRSKTAGM